MHYISLRKRFGMPTISMFYGILILMYYRDTRQHNLPHIHARYQDEEVVLEIQTGEVLAGAFPPKQLKLVQAWMIIHREELEMNWALAIEGNEPFRIAPLQ
jgi:hypothetical protein